MKKPTIRDLEIDLELLQRSARNTEEAAAAKQAAMLPYVKTADDMKRYKRVGYSATERAKRARAAAAWILSELETMRAQQVLDSLLG